LVTTKNGRIKSTIDIDEAGWHLTENGGPSFEEGG